MNLISKLALIRSNNRNFIGLTALLTGILPFSNVLFFMNPLYSDVDNFEVMANTTASKLLEL